MSTAQRVLWPAAGSAATTRPRRSSACCPRTSASRSSTTSTSCSTRRCSRAPRPGTLEPRHVVVPLRERLKRTELRLGWVTGGDPASATLQRQAARRPRGRFPLRPARDRARLGVADVSDPRPGRARDRVQDDRRGDRAAQPRSSATWRPPRRSTTRSCAGRTSTSCSWAAATPASRAWPSSRTSPTTRSRTTRAAGRPGCAGSSSTAAPRIMPEIQPQLAEFTQRLLRKRGVEMHARDAGHRGHRPDRDARRAAR